MSVKDLSNTDSVNYESLPTTWKLADLFGYQDYHDQKIAQDVKRGVREINKFANKWSKRKDWLTKPDVLKQALAEYFAPISTTKPMFYLGLLSTKQTTNTELQALDARFSDTIAKVAEKTLFFELLLGKVSKDQQKIFLKSSALVDYKFWLQELFAQAKFDLTEAEERIISRYARPKGSLWIETLQKMLNQKTVEYQGKQIPHTQAAAQVALETNTKKRHDLNNRVYQVYAELADLAEGSLNAILLNRKISNELRGFKHPYSATVLGYQNTDSEVEGLVQAVKDNYQIAHEFYKFKQSVMGLSEFTYADRNVTVGKVRKKYSFVDSVEIIHDVLQDFNTEAAQEFINMINRGQYDAFPAVGKQGGAYQAGQPTQPTMVFLNHVDGFDAMTTLAHETGHALHTYFAQKNQPLHYQNYPISTAEVASTFLENLVFYQQLPQMSVSDQFSALMSKMNGTINTIQRQIALFEIERRLHEEIKQSGHVSGDQMKGILLEEFRAHLGKHVRVDDNIGNFVFVMAQAHFANPFYVYAYAYGELIAQALYAVYQTDKQQGHDAVIRFMSAGSAAKPKDIFKKSGIIVGEELWNQGLAIMKSDLRHLKRLHRQLREN